MILEEAERHIVAEGHESLNMRDLAGRIGVSATTIYHYFENKEELLLQVKVKAVEKLNSRIRALDPDADPMEAIHQLGKEYITFAEEHPNLYRLLFETPVGATPLGEPQRPILYYTYTVARGILERMAEGKGYPYDPRYGAMMGWTMLHGYCSLIISGNLQLAEGMSRKELRELFLKFYTGGGGRMR
jgi:AcrR family transcriptional regulator